LPGLGLSRVKENPVPNLEEAIRERAYHLWLADGRPEGKADIHWLNAQHEILAASAASPDGAAAAADAAPKPPRRARSGKSRTRIT
jgi:hypothetical protein